ncbi:hypothetical protein [Candidatus Halobonum tyrrellensis]|uniref:Uncharacterized protein n=1 Tax=Candidatus Halobonum tyrrellensis G22 TaxID=1324957 RepID=V4HM70_9EURY|nr:hypothetical protein [Candidatus Halobonum tyrrellensis]ESP89024.1 hypothetical protein K933_06228 [Candidatus Halobonum tyrrellensis G22]
MVLVTRDLLSVLLERADAQDPEPANVRLDATPAGELSGDVDGVDPDAPVLTHFYFPEAGGSVAAVFGMDLGAPASRARFVSHPDGNPKLTKADDLAAAVIVVTPPYRADDVRAYDRHGRGLDLRVLDAVPPEERIGEVPGDADPDDTDRGSDGGPADGGAGGGRAGTDADADYSR